MSTEIRIPPTSRSHTSEATVNVAGSTLIMGLLVAVSVIALAVSFYSLAKSEAALSQSEGARKESRIMSYDVTYMRAHLLSRGIEIPANHEEAERGSPDHPERPEHTLAVTGERGAGRASVDAVLLRGESPGQP